ncbi:hypothetical protein [Thermus tengchongensis]|uniref:hypothetical protein n=1 Tax=Thermus tengchongensis TaxID=1214928 RepID=UPI001F118045|nr:hypothetical protein [Thermus tengchongensis]
MRLLGMLLALGLALAAPLEEARAHYQAGRMEAVLNALNPLLQGYDPPRRPSS